ncbi:MAG: hypothetical protein U0271_04275 [Polyangiaceae bacterium]
MRTSARIGVVAAPLIAWALVLALHPAVWARQPRMTSGTSPPFAYIGSFAELFAAGILAVGMTRSSRAELVAAALVGGGFALTFLWIGLHL